jgi:hypothetical protein
MGEAHVPEYAASEGAAAHEPDVEVVAEAPEAVEATDAALEVFVAVVAEAANTGPEAFAATAAMSADAGLAGFAAAGLAAWPEGAPGTGGIPNPAGDLCESVAVEDFAAPAGI